MRQGRMEVPIFTFLIVFMFIFTTVFNVVSASAGSISNRYPVGPGSTCEGSMTAKVKGPGEMDGSFPHWSETPVTRDPGTVPYERTPPVQGIGGTIEFRYSSCELLHGLGIDRGTTRNDPPVVDLYVEESLYLIPQVQTGIEQYVYDRSVMGEYQIDVYTASGIGAGELRDNLYHSYLNGTTGAVFVGDMPEVIFEMDDSFGSYDSFPCDLYFMDVDGVWSDDDTNGKLDYHGGSLEADIWISRIKASVITGELESLLTVSYFDKVHDYFMGDLRVNHTALIYVDDDWAAWGDLYAWNMSELYPEPILINEVADTNGADYIGNRVTGDYEFIQVHVHSSPTTHYFAQGGNVQATQVRNAPPQSLFMNLFCCSGSDYDALNNFGGTYLFFGKGLATIGSTKTGSMLNFGDFYTPMANGRTMGEAFLDWSKTTMERSREWLYGMSLQGDGLLTPKYNSVMYPPEFVDNHNGSIRVNQSSPENIRMDIDLTTQKGTLLDEGDYRINNGQWIKLFSADCNDYLEDWFISKNSLFEGNNTLSLRATTIFGVEEYFNLTIQKDTVPPQNVMVRVDDDTGYVNDRDVLLWIDGWDASGMGSMAVSNDGVIWGPWEEFGYTMPYRLGDNDGIHSIHVRVSDTFFNVATVHATVELDRVSPRDCVLKVNSGASYSSSRNVSLAISAVEDTDNFTMMSVSIFDHWNEVWVPFSDESLYELPDEEGIFQVFVKVRDRANNTSPSFSSAITFDPTPPVPLKIVSQKGATLTNSTTVDLELKAYDGTSGLSGMRFGFDGIEWSQWENYSSKKQIILPGDDGEKMIYFQVMDEAGNVYNETDVYTTLVLDTTPPVSEVVPAYPPDGTNGWYVSYPTVEIRHTGAEAFYRWGDMSGFVPYRYPLTVTEGIVSLYFHSIDAAGNREETNTHMFRTDTDPPVYEVEEICWESKNSRGWYHDEVVLEFTPFDRPLSEETVRVETTTVVDVKNNRFTLDVEGRNRITYWAVDEAGNVGPKENLTIMIDRTGPRLTVSHRVDGKTLVLDYHGSDGAGEIEFEIRSGDGSEPVITRDLHWEHEYIPGKYQAVVICRDESGLQTREYINFTVEKEILETFFYEGKVTFAGYLAIGGILLIMLVFFLLVKRRRKGKRESRSKEGLFSFKADPDEVDDGERKEIFSSAADLQDGPDDEPEGREGPDDDPDRRGPEFEDVESWDVVEEWTESDEFHESGDTEDIMDTGEIGDNSGPSETEESDYIREYADWEEDPDVSSSSEDSPDDAEDGMEYDDWVEEWLDDE